ncbi:protease complex subunit PrcB family protein [Gilvimarinus sp. SDUM040013]|uniref:Protease complex subunit PrcB family protein n=1 Tax=Gilvimarinus gilvus TaxID=3058038 RepID=A0ABU4S2X1_9GAMM|nr:protease complex subunit PrcB family protein [Gilvimarinus sp. SDUM040013]MDO3384816.1 protease complex subunit PrcB family protein [Gilvimarinus sp. SDUM040013]MDX6850851.1 protease complex subunit PrcB family protein [Gilvimarinus sp. SDUM040013]
MVSKVRNCIVIGLVCSLAACGSSDDAEHESLVAYTRLACPAVSSNTPYEDSLFTVIDNEHEYRERYLATALNSQQDAPAVDFDTHQVIMLYAGQKPSLGHSIDVESIAEHGEFLQVSYREGEPQSCGADAALSYPYCFVSVAINDKPVRFEGEVFNSCP